MELRSGYCLARSTGHGGDTQLLSAWAFVAFRKFKFYFQEEAQV